MKKLIKLNKMLVSSLTMFTLVISVVSCSKKASADVFDYGYINFTNELNQIDLNKDNNFVFNSSFNKFTNNIQNEDKDNLKFFVTNFNYDNIRLYDISNKNEKDIKIDAKWLKDFKNNIKIKNNKFEFLLNKKILSLDKIIFSQNFDLTISKKCNPNDSMVYKNITSFFQLSEDPKNNNNLTLKSDFINNINFFGIENDKMKLDFDTWSYGSTDEKLRFKKIKDQNLLCGNFDDKSIIDMETYSWSFTEDLRIESSLLFGISKNYSIIWKNDDNSMSINLFSNIIVGKIFVSGKFSKKDDSVFVSANIFGMFNCDPNKTTSLKTDGNYLINFYINN